MALPAHLEKYDGLLDLLVDALVCEIEREAETATPATSAKGTAGVNPATRSRARTHDKTTRPHSITAS